MFSMFHSFSFNGYHRVKCFRKKRRYFPASRASLSFVISETREIVLARKNDVDTTFR